MKTYTGTKTLFAKPMNRREYNDYRGWTTPVNEDGDDEGYLVEYTDGGKANDSRHLGYISWSPQDVFELSYKEVLVSTRPAYQERVITELRELQEKSTALAQFLTNSPVYETLPFVERTDLMLQHVHMCGYIAALERRIARFQ